MVYVGWEVLWWVGVYGACYVSAYLQHRHTIEKIPTPTLKQACNKFLQKNERTIYTMDLVHYIEGIPSAMHCGYFVLVKMLLCRHYPMLKCLCFSGVSQDLAISQTGYLTRKCSEQTSRHIIKVCESVIKERRNLLYYRLCHTI